MYRTEVTYLTGEKKIEWVFTDEEREDLENILQGIDKDCIRVFRLHLEYLCQCALSLSEERGPVYKRPSRQDRKMKIREYEKILTKALAVIVKLRNMGLPPAIPYNLNDLLGEQLWAKDYSTIQSCAIGAERDITKILKILKSSPDYTLPPGNPGTISKSFAEKIGEAFMEHLGRPTTTPSKYPGSGLFFQVVAFAFKAVGLNCEDVGKVVAQAVPKRLDKTQ